MKLSELLSSIDYTLLKGDADTEINNVVYDSRKVQKGDLFVCLKGYNVDAHKFAQSAVENGAVAVVLSDELELDCTVVKVADTRKALAYISAEYFGNPAKELTSIALTGTKGKTTTACMIQSILEESGVKTGTIGTLGIVYGGKTYKTDNTTPESYEIQRALRQMVNDGCKAFVIEASSLGLKWHRTDAIEFDCAVFTNFSDDHIGDSEHATLEEYLDCKKLLFKQCRHAFLNKDSGVFLEVAAACDCDYDTFGFTDDCGFSASNGELTRRPGFLGVSFDLCAKAKDNYRVDVGIPGRFNIYNALAAISVCTHCGVGKSAILAGLKNVKVKGRVEPVPVDSRYTLLIDYAHNALSMENVLTTLRKYNPNRLITMFGAGGNRPKIRRYEMGEISGRLSDLSVLTEDNSRYEDVMDIIEDIKTGIAKTDGKYVVVPKRKDAIRYCIDEAQEGDIIVLAGKGHEDYQEIKGVKYHMDERELIQEILRERE